MEALKELMQSLDFKNITTYIQSGNVVFQSKNMNSFKESVTNDLSEKISSAIEKQFGFEVPVITMTLEDLSTALNSNPFLKDKKKESAYMHITFLSSAPKPELFEAINQPNYLPDEITIIDKCVYLYCPLGYGNTKLHNTFLENKLKVKATTRNLKTSNELLTIAQRIHA